MWVLGFPNHRTSEHLLRIDHISLSYRDSVGARLIEYRSAKSQLDLYEVVDLFDSFSSMICDMCAC